MNTKERKVEFRTYTLCIVKFEKIRKFEKNLRNSEKLKTSAASIWTNFDIWGITVAPENLLNSWIQTCTTVEKMNTKEMKTK